MTLTIGAEAPRFELPDTDGQTWSIQDGDGSQATVVVDVNREGKRGQFYDANGPMSYDAAYLELALRRQLPLATLDDRLKAAAKAVGLPTYSP